jgi:hypothetical protein
MVKVIIALAIILIVVALVLGFITGFIPWQEQTSPANGEQPVTPTPGPATEPAPEPTLSPVPSKEGDVKFAFEVTDISGSGLSRTVTAKLTNTGSADAHNVWAKTEAFSQGSRIKLGGQEYLRTDIGLLTAGATITTEVTLSFSVMDGLKISQNGVTLNLTIYSDEYTETFTYDYKP